MYIKEGPLNNQSAGTPRDKWLARQPKLLDDFLIMGISLNDLLGIYPRIYWDLTIGIGDILWYSIILIGDIWRYCDMCDFLLDISSMVNCEILDIWCFFCGIHCLCIIPAMGLPQLPLVPRFRFAKGIMEEQRGRWLDLEFAISWAKIIGTMENGP